MMKKTLLCFFTIFVAACSKPSSQEIPEQDIQVQTEIKATVSESPQFDLNPKNKDIPQLDQFLDINQKDPQMSLVYWNLANSNLELSPEEVLQIFKPEYFKEDSSFEKERIVESLKKEQQDIERIVNFYDKKQYFSIPFDISNSEKYEGKVHAEFKGMYEYDHDRKGFKFMCVEEYAAGKFKVSRFSMTNNDMSLIDNTSNENREALCFLPFADQEKAEEIYNLYKESKISIRGDAYVKFSSRQAAENQNLNDSFTPTYQVVVETMAIKLKIERIEDGNGDFIHEESMRPVLYEAIVTSPKYYK